MHRGGNNHSLAPACMVPLAPGSRSPLTSSSSKPQASGDSDPLLAGEEDGNGRWTAGLEPSEENFSQIKQAPESLTITASPGNRCCPHLPPTPALSLLGSLLLLSLLVPMVVPAAGLKGAPFVPGGAGWHALGAAAGSPQSRTRCLWEAPPDLPPRSSTPTPQGRPGDPSTILSHKGRLTHPGP